MTVRFESRKRLLGLAAAVFVLLGAATACQPGALAITADPALCHTFQPAVIDYVNRCDPASPTDVSVNAPAGTTVSVDGQPPRSGSFTAQVSQGVGDRFTLRVTTDAGSTTHHVRCLPLDFPPWRAEKTGVTQSQYYATALPLTFGPAGSYGIVFDTNGVPVWWTENRKRTTLFSLLPNLHFGIELIDGGAQELALDGSLVRSVNTVGGPSDFHDFILLPNGNYLLATAQQQLADLSVWGPPYEADTPVINHVFQEITPRARWSGRGTRPSTSPSPRPPTRGGPSPNR